MFVAVAVTVTVWERKASTYTHVVEDCNTIYDFSRFLWCIVERAMFMHTAKTIAQMSNCPFNWASRYHVGHGIVVLSRAFDSIQNGFVKPRFMCIARVTCKKVLNLLWRKTSEMNYKTPDVDKRGAFHLVRQSLPNSQHCSPPLYMVSIFLLRAQFDQMKLSWVDPGSLAKIFNMV